ncbi:PhnD/SsuA/transferrin family substrate-binding protein [Nitriliruptoraceae bacterium ZYF776]|nr:PhnD/SsuA/transferrin family substrate-binding protein [Profundirhabdus halotolerans]
MRRHTKFTQVVVVATAFALAACGSDADDGGADGAAADDPVGEAEDETADDDGLAEDEMIPIRLTTLSLCNEIARYADVTGIFEEHGLDVELVNTDGGSAGLAAIQSGSADIAFVNPVTSLLAITQGVDVQIISGSGLTTEDTHGVVVAADSDIQGPEDLQGKTIGVNEIGGSGQFLTTQWIEEATGEDITADFVALPFPELVGAVEGGQIDAAQVNASLVAQIEESGGRSVGNPVFQGVGPTPTALYLATSDFIESQPEAAQAFVEAMEEAAIEGNDEAFDDEKFPILAEVCSGDAEQLAATPEQDYEGLIDMSALQTIADISFEGGLLEEPVTVEDVVPEFSRGN